MVMLKLFMAFFKISLFAFGGAYSFLPLMEAELVQNQQWLEEAEYLEIVGITKFIPGAISIKFATYTGYKIAGVPGAIVANIANMLPPVLFVILASMLYSKYKEVPFIKSAFEIVQYAVFAMIISIALQLIDKQHMFELKYLFVIVITFLLCFYTKVHPAYVIFGAGLFGAIIC